MTIENRNRIFRFAYAASVVACRIAESKKKLNQQRKPSFELQFFCFTSVRVGTRLLRGCVDKKKKSNKRSTKRATSFNANRQIDR
jgi:hypothetical protein